MKPSDHEFNSRHPWLAQFSWFGHIKHKSNFYRSFFNGQFSNPNLNGSWKVTIRLPPYMCPSRSQWLFIIFPLSLSCSLYFFACLHILFWFQMSCVDLPLCSLRLTGNCKEMKNILFHPTIGLNHIQNSPYSLLSITVS